MTYIATIKEPRRRNDAYIIRLRAGSDKGKIVRIKQCYTFAKAFKLARELEAEARAPGWTE